MSDLSVPYAAPRERPVVVRRIQVADVRAALSEGWSDFLAVPTHLVFLCLLYPVVGLVAARAAFQGDLLPLLFPLVAGLSLLGPVLAVGVYELSWRRERGLPVSWLNAFDILRSPSLGPIAVVGALLLGLFTCWLIAAKLVFAATLGSDLPMTLDGFAHAVMMSSAGWAMILVGNVVGFCFAVVVLTLTVVSVPMLLDRTLSPAVAIQTSVRAVAANPVPMAAWGATVAVVLALGCLPLFMGLAVAMPVLGHATWRLYRKVVG